MIKYLTIQIIILLLINPKAFAQNNSKKTLNNTESIFSVIDKLPDSLKIKTLRKESLRCREIGDYVSSIIISKELLKYKNTFNDSVKKAKFRIWVNGNIGLYYNNLGLYSKAISYSSKALLDAKKINDTVSIILTLSAISTQYNELILPELAKKTCFKALEYAKKINNNNLKKIIYNNIGNIYSEINKNDSAIYYYKISNNLSEKITGKPSTGVFLNIGNLYFKENNLDSAIFYYKLSKNGISSENTKLTNSMLFNGIANAYYSQNKHNSAEEYAFKSLKIALTNNYYDQIIEAYKLIALIYTKKKDYKKSIIYQNKYTRLKDSVMAVNQQTAVSRIELIYDAENKKLKINKLKAENLLKSGKLKVLIIFLILTIIVSIIIYYQKNKIKKAYNLIVKDNIKSKNLYEEIKLLRIELNNIKKTKYDFTKEKKTLYENKNIVLTEKQADFIEFEIRKAFDEDKIYLDKNLSLKTLSDYIGSNRYYISQVLNNKMKINFSEMLNTYRVNEAKKILLEENSSKYTFEAIAEKSGFNSKATFYRAFKKNTGITPSFFLKNAKNNLYE